MTKVRWVSVILGVLFLPYSLDHPGTYGLVEYVLLSIIPAILILCPIYLEYKEKNQSEIKKYLEELQEDWNRAFTFHKEDEMKIVSNKMDAIKELIKRIEK